MSYLAYRGQKLRRKQLSTVATADSIRLIIENSAPYDKAHQFTFGRCLLAGVVHSRKSLEVRSTVCQSTSCVVVCVRMTGQRPTAASPHCHINHSLKILPPPSAEIQSSSAATAFRHIAANAGFARTFYVHFFERGRR